jgi:hypothetical protein
MTLFNGANLFDLKPDDEWTSPVGHEEPSGEVDISRLSEADRRLEIADRILIQVGAKLVAEGIEHVASSGDFNSPNRADLERKFYLSLGWNAIKAINLFLAGAIPIEGGGDGSR